MKPTTYIDNAELVEIEPNRFLLCVQESNLNVERNAFKSPNAAYAFALTRYALPKWKISYFPLVDYEGIDS
jgi:hypothetical protein